MDYPLKEENWPADCRQSGFTAIEILSVIIMIGILVVLIIPSFDKSGLDISAAGQMVKGDLRYLQKLAMARNPSSSGAVAITFTNGTSSYSINDPSNVFNYTRNLPEGVTISGNKTISFNRYGEPEFAGATETVVLTGSGQTATLTIQRFTGRVTISG